MCSYLVVDPLPDDSPIPHQPSGHVVLKHTKDQKNAQPSLLYKSREHACVALIPPHLKVEEEMICLRRDISNMLIPRRDMVHSCDSIGSNPCLPLVDLSTCNEVCNQVMEANAQRENVLREKAPWLLPETYKAAKREMRHLDLVGGVFDKKPSNFFWVLQYFDAKPPR